VAVGSVLTVFRRDEQTRTLAAIIWAMMLYLAAVHVVFAAPHWRYSLTTIPGLILLATLGIARRISGDDRTPLIA
jgi:hypothetical protein